MATKTVVPIDSVSGDTDIEAKLIGSCLHGREDRLIVTEALRDPDSNQFLFFGIENRICYSHIFRLAEQGANVDVVTLRDSLLAAGELKKAGGEDYLLRLDRGLPDQPAIREYVQVVLAKADHRRLASITKLAFEQASNRDAPASEIIRRMNDQIYSGFSQSQTSALISTKDLVASVPRMTLINPVAAQTGPRLLTGFRQLDRLTGGIAKHKIWLILARPGVGKTTLVLQMLMHNLLRGIPCGFFSYELGWSEVAAKIICQHADVEMTRYLSGELFDDELERVALAVEFFESLPLYIEDASGLSAADTHMRIKRAQDQHGIQLAGIDYIQRMSDHERGSNETERLKRTCAGIIQMAKDSVPIIAISQTKQADSTENKSGSKKGQEQKARLPSLRDAKGGIEMESICDVGLIPFRPVLENPDEDPNEALLLLRKNRFGKVKPIRARFVGKYNPQFEEV